MTTDPICVIKTVFGTFILTFTFTLFLKFSKRFGLTDVKPKITKIYVLRFITSAIGFSFVIGLIFRFTRSLFK